MNPRQRILKRKSLPNSLLGLTFFNVILFLRDVEGELIRSIWDTSYRTHARTLAAQRSKTSELSSNLARNQSIHEKHTSASENENIDDFFVNLSE